ncbi:flap endonuclease GEN-like 1 [Beta vulgaris subsp. vulgaris]|uniref:flap endonuclease GEN-like 1 n=1 Tax=Beta vulgaris subsp. vulgaris TaxID=3555 RepID=UPI002036C58F|nr:flap endonuclease GEN-like 1 [Beta vulgaris subsp. vulgaris]
MGIGAKFWDALKPYAKHEGFDFLRNKKVAVDLSLWIVQHNTALNSSNVRNPHIRLTFFRTINLFSKFGAYPVFVVDGKPSPLKSQARIARYFRSSGIDSKDLPVAEEGVCVERNDYFVKCVEECVELLKLLGMPVLRAKGEAEALCAQLNNEGFVDACITADSDAFLFGAKCVIKQVDPKSTEPFECYYAGDIEVGLGLRRKHLIAVSLLVGNDHNLNGVQGIGLETALRFVKKFHEDEVLQRLNEIGSQPVLPSDANLSSPVNCTSNMDKLSQKFKSPHCSLCGHPGNKTAHSRVPCGYCHSTAGVNCSKKPPGFRCECSGCVRDLKERELKKNEHWHLRVCKKISMECHFPCNEITEIYMRNEDSDDFSASLLWDGPDIDMLIDFLAFHLHWDPSYIRQQIFQMLSTISLREMALNPSETLLLGQYKFDSVQRVKVRCGHQFYVVRWKKSAPAMNNVNHSVSSEGYFVDSASQSEEIQMDGSCGLDELNGPQLHVDGGCSFILTDENLELVQAASPAEVDRFLQQKEVKESKRKSRSGETCVESHSPNLGSGQLAITDYYRSSKPLTQAKDNHDLAQSEEAECLREKSKVTTASLPKSVRRRLLFS